MERGPKDSHERPGDAQPEMTELERERLVWALIREFARKQSMENWRAKAMFPGIIRTIYETGEEPTV